MESLPRHQIRVGGYVCLCVRVIKCQKTRSRGSASAVVGAGTRKVPDVLVGATASITEWVLNGSQVKMMSHDQLGPNMRKILGILADHPKLTVTEVAELVYGKTIKSKSNEYYSTYRSLRDLKKRQLVKSEGGRVLWSKTQ